MKIVMFKTRKPKQFTYKSRYYDPEKEELEQRKLQRLRRIEGGTTGLREEMSRKWHRKTKKKSNYMTLLYIVALILLIYFMLKI